MDAVTAIKDAVRPQHNRLMHSFSAHFNREHQRKKLWQAQGIAYLLAVLAHAALWQFFLAMPAKQASPEEPPVIEVSLVTAPPAPKSAPAPAATAPAPPPPRVQPPPVAKPIPKVEKPAPRKLDKPKPKPTPKPRAEPQAEAEPTPAPVQEAPPAPAPSAATARAEAPHAGKASSGSSENTQYHPGGMSGLKKRFPRQALERGWEGTVTLRVHILADGEIGEVIVANGSGHEILDEQAVELVREAHATPARRGDKAVDSWVIIPYQFKIEKH